MPSVYDTLCNWARRTTTSFAELRFVTSAQDDDQPLTGLIYRLKHWPDLPRHHRTADVYRALSVMSSRPVNRHWILSHSRLHEEQLDSLLHRLVREGAVEAIDAAKFPQAPERERAAKPR
jgi:hypothetical protein